MPLSQKDKLLFKQLHDSPLVFVERVWHLTPQPPKPEFKSRLDAILLLQGAEWEQSKHEIKADWFGTQLPAGTWSWYNFHLGKHITWQQLLILKSIEKAVNNQASKLISVSSGRGLGKSSSLSWLILWFLFTRPDSQIPCTAPTSDQMYDVLWKELATWIFRMPKNIKDKFQWESQHIRVLDDPESPYRWFARAKTASKEKPEALSGVHGPFILAAIDEASAVPDEIFETSKGIFAQERAYMILISNPTRLNGHFYRTHNQLKDKYQCLQFSSLESPIVDQEMIESYKEEGLDSDSYRVNVLGDFPREDSIDELSFIPLLTESSIKMIPEHNGHYRNPMLGIDPSGEGDDESAFGIRDNFIGEIIGTEAKSTSKSVAALALAFMDRYKVKPQNTICDSFGVGSDVGKEIALSSRKNIYTINVGERPDHERDMELFVNKRALMYWRFKEWLERGGLLVYNKKLRDQLLSIRFRRTFAGKIEIMSKRIMRKQGLPSPDLADSLAFSFLRKPVIEENDEYQLIHQSEFDQFAVF